MNAYLTDTKPDTAAQARVLAKLPSTASQLSMPERLQLKLMERAGLIEYTGEIWRVVGAPVVSLDQQVLDLLRANGASTVSQLAERVGTQIQVAQVLGQLVRKGLVVRTVKQEWDKQRGSHGSSLFGGAGVMKRRRAYFSIAEGK